MVNKDREAINEWFKNNGLGIVVLSLESFKKIIDMGENPPPPTKKLTDLMKEVTYE